MIIFSHLLLSMYMSLKRRKKKSGNINFRNASEIVNKSLSVESALSAKSPIVVEIQHKILEKNH